MRFIMPLKKKSSNSKHSNLKFKISWSSCRSLKNLKKGGWGDHQDLWEPLISAEWNKFNTANNKSIGWDMYTNLVLCELAGINELVLLITGTSPLYSVRGRLTCLSDPGDKIWQGEKIPYKPINHGNREYANFNNVLYSPKLARE